MNKRQRIVQGRFLDNEEAAIKRLTQVYNKSFQDVSEQSQKLYDEIEAMTAELDIIEDEDEREILKSRIRSKVYQKKYQDGLKKQIGDILDNMHEAEYKTVSEYLDKCYEEGFVGAMYDLQGQGIPLCFPIDQEAVTRAVQLDSKISEGLYKHLGEDVSQLKKHITAQVSRGIVTGMSYSQIARNLSGKMTGNYKGKAGGSLAYAQRIARTEGHRIQCQAAMDCCFYAKDRGADIVKKWDSTLDARTRHSHALVDGEVKEIEEAFSNGLMFPGDPNGRAAEVINCRCALLEIPREDIGKSFTKMNNFTKELEEFESPEDYDEFKKAFFSKENRQYMNYVSDMEMKYGTKNFEKLLGNMSDLEYKHIIDLQNKSPLYGGKKAEKVKNIADVNNKGSDIMKQNYEAHRLKNQLEAIPYDEMSELGKKNINVDYGNLSVESAAVFNDTIEKLSKEYDTPLYKIRVMTKDERMTRGNSFAFVVHNYENDTAELVIQPNKCKDINELRDKILSLSESGYCAKISDKMAEKYIATHEFAHTILNVRMPLNNKRNWVKADYTKINKARKEIEIIHNNYMEEVKILTDVQKKYELEALLSPDASTWEKAKKASDNLNSVKISNYSLEDIDEFMAEAFTNEKLGISNKYGKQVVEVLDKYFKR